MSRRFHRKSKNGCFECKKRHIKCDETRPVCINCSGSELRCSFLDKNTPQIIPSFTPQIYPHTAPGLSSNIVSAEVLNNVPAGANFAFDLMPISHLQTDPFAINMVHIELFHNIYSKELQSLEEPGRPGTVPTTVIIKFAVSTPYLMHQMLGMSALHLSIKRSESSAFYRDYATGLQNRALTLFNESNPILDVNAANCVQVFLFSSSVSIHLLCDTLHYHTTTLDHFIDKFANDLSLYRGVLTVVEQCKRLMPPEQLGPRLETTELFLKLSDAEGSECDILNDLIDSLDISSASKSACRAAVFKLQQLFDAQQAEKGKKNARIPVMVSWPITVTSDYVELLRQRRPEALIILAHYAVLLHRGRHLWLVGNGGKFLIESVCASLSEEWQKWLVFPKEVLLEPAIGW